jgi:hypothetical protein
MKKILIVLVVLICGLTANSQTAAITITESWRNADPDNDSLLIRWVTDAELTGIPGTKKYYISNTWDPGNTVLNSIRVYGGDTENWPLYWVVNDTTFFYESVDGITGYDTLSIKSVNHMPNKTWGEYFKQSHEMYYRSATNPDQYIILAANHDGDILTLNEMVTIKQLFSSYIPSYWTLPALTSNQDKVQRNTSTGKFE